MKVAGAAVEGGKLYIAVCEMNDGSEPVPVENGARRLEPNAGLDVAHRLVDLTHRVEQDLRELAVDRLVLVKTRKTSALTYDEALGRIANVCALMAACVAQDVPFEEVTTTVIGKRHGVDPKALQDLPYSAFGFENQPTYWRAGLAKAYGATAVSSGRPGEKP